jgi:hypothetical protein
MLKLCTVGFFDNNKFADLLLYIHSLHLGLTLNILIIVLLGGET